jgi:hypothetical protein
VFGDTPLCLRLQLLLRLQLVHLPEELLEQLASERLFHNFHRSAALDGVLLA